MLLLSGCSTVEKHVYYYPKTTASTEKNYNLGCGFTSFGGKPDSVIIELNHEIQFKIKTNSSFEPYLFGPSFLSVVPVFPITWVVDLLFDADLSIHSNKDIFIDNPHLIYIEQYNSQHSIIKPNQINQRHITFPIKVKDVENFTIVVNLPSQTPIKIKFFKDSRWAWTQISPNC